MKIICIILMLASFFLISCEKKHKNNDNKNDELINFYENNDVTIQSIGQNNDEIDYYFDIINEGVYTIDINHNFEMIINKNAYLDRRYGNLLIFRYNDRSTTDNRGSYFVYDYLTKVQIDIALNLIKTIKFIPDNKIEITGINWYPREDNTVTVEYFHNYVDRIIDYDNEHNETLCVYNSLSTIETSYIIEIFNKMIYFDFANIKPRLDPPRLEIYYDDYHNVYYLCAWAINGIIH